MRVSEYRAKSLFKSEWWFGYYVYSEYTGKHFIAQDAIEDDKGFVSFAHFAEIDPKTLGKFTGLNDKNRNPIYEGDIVKFYTESSRRKGKIEVVSIDEGRLYPFYDDSYIQDEQGDWFIYDKGFQIIGNIHEHKNLLP